MTRVTAEDIRRFLIANLDSFRRGNRWVIRAGTVGRRMGYSGRMRNTCQVLGGGKFLGEAGLTLVDRTGPDDSTTTEFVYERTVATASSNAD